MNREIHSAGVVRPGRHDGIRPEVPNFSEWQTPPFHLDLLGPFALRGHGLIDPLPKKAQGLLAYLVMHRTRSIPREQLATLLWDRSGTSQARRSLRGCLVMLRSVLRPAADAILVASSSNVHFAASSRIDVDVLKFEALSRSTTLEQLEEATTLYRDEFLLGLQVTSESFTEWMLAERRRLFSMMSDILYRLATIRAVAGNIDGAIEIAERLTAFDPLREDGHRLLIEFLASTGRRSAALKQLSRCEDVLRRELGVMPELATTELAGMIRKGEAIKTGFTDTGISIADSSRKHDHVASARRVGGAGLAFRLPNRTSIAVLPFANLSGDLDQGYFADGVAEDVTMVLGRVPWLFVIGSSATSPYRGQVANAQQIGAELGVQYVLRGSVRKNGDCVRIVVQLTSAFHGGQIWAERFEGDLHDVFAIQDRVATQVSALIAPALQTVEIERSQRKPPQNLTAYDLYLRALPRFRTTFAENIEAVQFLYKAIELDPLYGSAYGLAARCYQFQRLFGWVQASDPRLQEGVRLAHLAADIGKSDSEALWMAGIALGQLAGEMHHGRALVEKSLSLNPNSASAWISGSFILGALGETDAALAHFDQAQRLNPLDSTHHVQWLAAGFAHFAAARYREAAEAVDKTLHARPTYTPAVRMKVALCGLLSQNREGDKWVRRLLAANPDASVSWFRTFWQIPLRGNPRLLAQFLEGARLAGLPEGKQG